MRSNMYRPRNIPQDFGSDTPMMLPDPKDASINEPAILLNPEFIIMAWNNNAVKRSNGLKPKQEVDEELLKWFHDELIKLGWNHVEFFGSQCFIAARLSLQS